MKQGWKVAASFTAVPWNAFVGAFLYYVLLAAIALAGVSPSAAAVGTAYLAPAVAYGVFVLGRIAGALGHFFHGGNLRGVRGH